MKKALICLSIIAILIFCVPNVAVASTSNYSTFHNNTQRTGNHIAIAMGSTSNGISNWKYATKGIAPPTATLNGIVYIGNGDHNVYALNANTGTKIWNYTTGSFVWSSPAVANGIVYVSSADRNVYALNANTGTKVWNYTTGNWVHSSPTLANGIVYIGSLDHNVYALNANTGKLVWSYTTRNPVRSSPTVANGIG
jgi:outer membrane protein assembly factor BamB